MLLKHFDPASYDAFLFDLDGVLTPTVDVHRRAWQRTFDALFAAMELQPYSEAEYFESLDGRARFDGVATLLKARGIELPAEGGAGWQASVRGIGNRKNDVFTEVLERDGIEAYPGSLRLLDQLRQFGTPLAVVSSSRNAEAVLRAAGIRDRFLAVVDGVVAAREHLPGKPAPDTFLRAAAQLGVSPERSVVCEDATSGVEAGRAGGFGLVVGVDRGAGESALRNAGAHRVVQDLEELTQ
ncbi:beta-phosphoglucomutase family hydrolase [Leucobacter insecticola]|uniref:Beta-phosphoglucomutase family hydrolase n=1 Tax=Leucobacter insecticola TaxID=2714934 RepID=A0A6G8FLT4_9MICO|nr:beta-phosphoglucomutase family hydrolase [Leucobacter insecticola]QIM17450.1 beta-phosphoglucomutase family hydrolase [Leucobacter insecticola]